MTRDNRFLIKDTNIVAEIFGDEVVIVNLESGIYYSLRGTSAQVWIRLQNGYSLTEAIDELSSMYDGSPAEIAELAEAFTRELINHQLIKISSNGTERIPADSNLPRSLFTKPVIEIFSDMQDILLLDPVHDVDPEGWPVTKDQKKSA